MYNLNDNELATYINDDIPYIDLTTYLQESDDTMVSLEFFTREDIVLSCMEEAKRVAQILECEIIQFTKSGEYAKKGEVFFTISGKYANIQKAWKLCQIMLEYSCKISTITNQTIKTIKEVNPNCGLFGTRKTFPFSKRFCIKSLLIGGGYPHRLGLSESILFFPQHRCLYKNDKEFFKKIKKIKSKMPEKKLIIESSNFIDAKSAILASADVIQLDKVSLDETAKIIKYKNKNFPNVKILSAGGINNKNAKDYAALGIDGIVTSFMYLCGLADISTKMKLV